MKQIKLHPKQDKAKNAKWSGKRRDCLFLSEDNHGTKHAILIGAVS